MLIGYIRVSTNDQNTDLQRNALMCAGCEQIFEKSRQGCIRPCSRQGARQPHSPVESDNGSACCL
ncbi:DNA-invertase, partial [Escherichia coli KTE55]